MKTFYYAEGDKRVGPVSLDEVANAAIQPDTLVWSEGLPDWVPATDLVELREVFAKLPPPIKPRPVVVPPLPVATTSPAPSEQFTVSPSPVRKRANSSRTALIVVISLVVVAVLALVIADNNRSRIPSAAEVAAVERAGEAAADIPKTPEQLRAELEVTERTQPLAYLSVSYRTWKNLIDETVIEGDIHNGATLAVYKDALIRATFYSSSDTELGYQEERVYQYTTPGATSHFKFKFNAPRDTRKIDVRVVRAKPVSPN